MLVPLRTQRRRALGDTNLWDVWGTQPGSDVPQDWGYDGPGGYNPTQVFSPGGGFNWANLANTLTTDFTKIYGAVQPVPAGCTKVRGANGQEYTSCSGTPIAPQPGGAFSFGSGGGGMSMGTLLLIGGAVVGGALLLGRRT